MTVIVFLVAGMSSRFGGNPKQMAIVGPNNETLIEYSVNQALKAKFSKIIFITNSKTEKLFFDIFGNSYRSIPVEYIEQKYDKSERTRPWGTADAISSIQIDEPFIMLNGDDIYGENSFKIGFELIEKNMTNIIGGIKIIDTLPENGIVNRGVIFTRIDPDTGINMVTGLKEMLNISKPNNPELHNESGNMNFIGLQPDALKEIKKIVDDFKNAHKDDPKIECMLTDIIGDLINTNKMVMQYFDLPNKIIGITNPGDEITVRELLK